jgi:hypothetical protein
MENNVKQTKNWLHNYTITISLIVIVGFIFVYVFFFNNQNGTNLNINNQINQSVMYATTTIADLVNEMIPDGKYGDLVSVVGNVTQKGEFIQNNFLNKTKINSYTSYYLKISDGIFAVLVQKTNPNILEQYNVGDVVFIKNATTGALGSCEDPEDNNIIGKICDEFKVRNQKSVPVLVLIGDGAISIVKKSPTGSQLNNSISKVSVDVFK